MTKRVRFSYRAKSRSILVGEGPLTLALDVEELYATIFFESSLLTS